MKKFKDFLNESEGDVKSRFMEKVSKTKGGCWVYKAHKTKYGYGQFWNNGSAKQAHRASWEISRGAIPKGKVLLHKCDNRKCVNPAHMKLGSISDNNNDMAKKGRIRNQYTGPLKGSPRDKGDQESKSRK